MDRPKYLRAASAPLLPKSVGLSSASPAGARVAMEAPKRAAGRGCVKCGQRAHLKRPKTLEAICRPCFFEAFENEVHETIVSSKLFKPGERVAIAASGAGLLQCFVMQRLMQPHCARPLVCRQSPFSLGETARRDLFERV